MKLFDFEVIHLSDTHGYHQNLKLPPRHSTLEETDKRVIIHSGDSTNRSNTAENKREFELFVQWYASLDADLKIYVAGNHDTYLERCPAPAELLLKMNNIVYLKDSWVEFCGVKIYGSPWTPTFGNWSFMKDRSKLAPIWDGIPEDTEILVTHGPPKNVLDLTYDLFGGMIQCGDKSLFNRVVALPNLKLHCFGHIHNFEDLENSGTRKVSNCNVLFSNAAMVQDRRFDKGLINNGNWFIE